MSTKPIDEFLQDCTVWLEKIATAKQREEAAYAAINDVQMEKKALRMLARGVGYGVRGLGHTLRAPGRFLTRLGNKLFRWGSKNKVNPAATPPPVPAAPAPANAPVAAPKIDPLTRLKDTVRVSKSKKGVKYYSAGSGKQLTEKQVQNMLKQVQTKFGLSADAFTSQLQARGSNAAFAKATNAFRANNGLAPVFNSKMQRIAPANAPVKAPTTQPAPAKTANPAAPVDAPKGQTGAGTQAGANAGADAAAAQPGMLGKVMPYALVGGAGVLAGRSTAPTPAYSSPAMDYNNAMARQQQQAAAPNIY